LIDNLALRIKRNTAGHALNDIDSDFKQKTENKFDSLAQAATVILSNDYSSLWKNQDALASFSDNYSQAKSFFDKGNFDMSINFSAKAKANAVTVLKDGFIEQRPTIDWTLWIYFAIGIVVLFAIIFALRNRGKLSALVQPQQEGEEIEIRGWERKN
jgi:hypothetical protein